MLDIQTIYNEALIMKPIEKIKLIEQLILSLNLPNESIEKQWSKEVEDRVKAYKDGEIKALSAKEVFGKYEL